MIWRLFPFVLATILVAGVMVSDLLASRLAHVPQGRLTGDDLKENFFQGNQKLAMLDEPGTLRFLSPEKARMIKNLNPHLLEDSAFAIIDLNEAPKLKELAPLAAPTLSQ
jgi:hypothetical protein